MNTPFKLTYSTMFDPPPELHTRFEAALATHDGCISAPSMRCSSTARAVRATRAVRGTKSDRPARSSSAASRPAMPALADAAVAAAKRAFPAWAATPWPERVERLRRAAALIEERVYFIGAALALEVGKNRMESLGEAQETADLIAYYCDQMEANDGYVRAMASDPLRGLREREHERAEAVRRLARDRAVQLSAGARRRAVGRRTRRRQHGRASRRRRRRRGADGCSPTRFATPGLPPGVFNYVTGPGASLGEALIRHPDVAGVTFTGIARGRHASASHVRRGSAGRGRASPKWAARTRRSSRRRANLADAATGVMRSAFGLSGQKCSACSRVYVEHTVFNDFVARCTRAARASRSAIRRSARTGWGR